MDELKFMLFLRNPVNPFLREILKPYIMKKDQLEFIICTKWKQNGDFVYLNAENTKNNTCWGINIPVDAVLSITDYSEVESIMFDGKSKGARL